MYGLRGMGNNDRDSKLGAFPEEAPAPAAAALSSAEDGATAERTPRLPTSGWSLFNEQCNQKDSNTERQLLFHQQSVRGRSPAQPRREEHLCSSLLLHQAGERSARAEGRAREHKEKQSSGCLSLGSRATGDLPIEEFLWSFRGSSCACIQSGPTEAPLNII